MTATGEMDWTDRRPLDKLTFGIALPEAERPAAAEKVRGLLTMLGVTIAEDIKSIGCTTIAAARTEVDAGDGGSISAEAIGQAITTGRFLRMALGGSGIGLTCYVPSTRYCHVHDTVGGLQENQAQNHPEMVEHISRDLTPEERVKTGLVEHVRHMDEATDRQRADILRGKKLPPEFMPDADEDDAVGPGAGPEILEPPMSDLPFLRGGATINADDAWKCPEHHPEFATACRFCLAGAIVRGPLQPSAILVWGDGTEDETAQVKLTEVDAKVDALNDGGDVDKAALYIKAVRWTRRLARE